MRPLLEQLRDVLDSYKDQAREEREAAEKAARIDRARLELEEMAGQPVRIGEPQYAQGIQVNALGYQPRNKTWRDVRDEQIVQAVLFYFDGGGE